MGRDARCPWQSITCMAGNFSWSLPADVTRAPTLLINWCNFLMMVLFRRSVVVVSSCSSLVMTSHCISHHSSFDSQSFASFSFGSRLDLVMSSWQLRAKSRRPSFFFRFVRVFFLFPLKWFWFQYSSIHVQLVITYQCTATSLVGWSKRVESFCCYTYPTVLLMGRWRNCACSLFMKFRADGLVVHPAIPAEVITIWWFYLSLSEEAALCTSLCGEKRQKLGTFLCPISACCL
jgi:hypothetical protein